MIGTQSLSGVVGRAGGGGGGRAPRGRHPPHERPDLLEVRLLRGPPATVVTVLCFMLLQMPVQVSLLPEAAVTVTATKRPFLIMNISHVPLQI